MKYLRLYLVKQDPGFEGTMRDIINKAEKFRLVKDANQWLGIRGLRNAAAHEYNDTDLVPFFKRLLAETPTLLAVKDVL